MSSTLLNSGFAILGNPSYPIPHQFLQLFHCIVHDHKELDWDKFNALRRIVNGLIELANKNNDTVFPGIPDSDPVLVERMFKKLMTEIRHLQQACPDGKYKEMLANSLNKYNPIERQPAQKRSRPEQIKESELLNLDMSAFKTLVPYQATLLTSLDKTVKKNNEDGKNSSFLNDYLKSKENHSKAYWEYLF